MKELNELKSKIEAALAVNYPDMVVVIDEKWQTATDCNYKSMGERAYPGMVESRIEVSWGKFYDGLCGNGWMYVYTWLFKFDAADGTCKYDGYPATVEEAVDLFIQKMSR